MTDLPYMLEAELSLLGVKTGRKVREAEGFGNPWLDYHPKYTYDDYRDGKELPF